MASQASLPAEEVVAVAASQALLPEAAGAPSHAGAEVASHAGAEVVAEAQPDAGPRQGAAAPEAWLRAAEEAAAVPEAWLQVAAVAEPEVWPQAVEAVPEAWPRAVAARPSAAASASRRDRVLPWPARRRSARPGRARRSLQVASL